MKKIFILSILAFLVTGYAWAGVWQMAGHMPQGAADDMAATTFKDSLGNTCIITIGGQRGGTSLYDVTYYNPSSGNWYYKAPLPKTLMAARALSIIDTIIYLNGGYSQSTGSYSNTTYTMRDTGYWHEIGGLNTTNNMANHGFVWLPSPYGYPYLYAVSGSTSGLADSMMERLDPSSYTKTWSKDMPAARTNAVVASAIGQDGQPHIYVIGGKNNTSMLTSTVLQYDTTGALGSWSFKTAMPGPSRWQAAGAALGGKIYVIGGISDLIGTVTRRVDIYDPQTDTWSLGDSIPEPLCRASAVAYNNAIYIFGGYNKTTGMQSDSVWQYRPFAPNPPLLANPPHNAFSNQQTQNFFWHPVAGAVGYMIQVTDDSTFNTISVVNSYVVDTSTTGLSPYLTPEGKFYWRVKVYMPTDSSNWSQPRCLRLDLTPPEQPALSTPMDLTVTNSMDVYFSWFAVDSIMSYHLQVSKEQDFIAPVANVYDLGNSYANLNFAAYGEGQYYWRVESKDSAGNFSGFGAVATFTIDQTAPWVIYTNPSNGELSVPVGSEIVIGFSEPINYTIAGNFNFTCSPDPMGWFESWNGAGDTVTLSHNDFSGGQYVSFTVTNAKDMAGNTLVASYAWSFNTVDNDYTPPNITYVKCSDDPLYAGSAYSPFTVNASDDKKMDSVRVYWGTAGYSGYNFSRTLTEVSPGQYQTTINGYEIGMEGVQYQVEAVDSAGNASYYPSGGDYYIHSVYLSGQIPTTPFPYDKWQMVSIPAYAIGSNIFNQMVNILGPYDNTKWRLYQWAGGGYNEISAPTTISELGRAYWLRRRTGPNNITFPGAISSYGDFNQSKRCSLDLYTGWNDLGTPFMFDINWGNITIPAGVFGPYTYDGSRWLLPNEVTTSMNFTSYQGFSFRNDNGYPTYLGIDPISANKKDGKSATIKSPNGWQAMVLVENEAGSDHNYFGLSSDASIERDQYDYPEPPSGMTGTSGYFRLADDQFCTDIRSEIGDGQVWDFAVECNGATKLSVKLPAEFPAGTECYLADLTRQVSVNVSDMKAYNFLPETGEGTREFKIIVGSSEYAKQVLGRTFSVPAATVLNQNTPNPFTDRTSISYELAAGGQVKIAVYNVTGQLIRTLLDEFQMTGRYNIGWDGRDQTGRKVAAGLYFCQLQAPGRSVTRRMALVR